MTLVMFRMFSVPCGAQATLYNQIEHKYEMRKYVVLGYKMYATMRFSFIVCTLCLLLRLDGTSRQLSQTLPLLPHAILPSITATSHRTNVTLALDWLTNGRSTETLAMSARDGERWQ